MATPTLANTPLVSVYPATMKAWIHSATGPPDRVLSFSPNLPTPKRPTGDEVLVKISHAALNHRGSRTIQTCPMASRAFPSIPEMDFVGKIVQVGPDVPESRDLNPDTDVFGSIPVDANMWLGKGALAEYVVVKAENVCIKPKKLRVPQAAGLPIAGCTALAMMNAAKLEIGMKVLINGACGGVGIIAVQLARIAVGQQGEVVGVCSKANMKLVERKGANKVIDYEYEYNHPLHRSLGYHEFDAVLDACGNQELFDNCGRFLKPGRPYITAGVAPRTQTKRSKLFSVLRRKLTVLKSRLPRKKTRQYIQVKATANLEDMQFLADLAQNAHLKVPLDSIWEMKDVKKAYEVLLSKHAKGKVVVKIDSV